MHKTKKQKKHNGNVKNEQQIVFMGFCRKTKSRNFVVYGKNLRRQRPQRRNSHVQWTIFSH